MFRVHKDAGFYHTKPLLGRRKWNGSCHEPFWPTTGNEPKARRLISSQRDFSTSRRDRDRFDYGVSRTWAPPISIVVAFSSSTDLQTTQSALEVQLCPPLVWVDFHMHIYAFSRCFYSKQLPEKLFVKETSIFVIYNAMFIRQLC